MLGYRYVRTKVTRHRHDDLHLDHQDRQLRSAANPNAAGGTVTSTFIKNTSLDDDHRLPADL
jgi:hypothetical protein